jgi:radical SAM protein with 4Fe4S-binding SPASM domain
MEVAIRDWPDLKLVRSPGYNYNFAKTTGFFARWGESIKDDPQVAPLPEILDIEISTGGCSGSCPWCYKSNTRGQGRNMSLATFRSVIDKMTPFLTQCALGLTDVDTNPDLIPIMEYAREAGVVPNLTLTGHGLTDQLAENIARLAGAVAVSVYPHTRGLAYRTIQRFQELGIEQVNAHLLYYQENLEFVWEVLFQDSYNIHPHAWVLLALKQAGRGVGLTPFTQDQFDALVTRAFENEIPLGFDSCSAPKFLDWLGRQEMTDRARQQLEQQVEPCESGLFSAYINVDGVFYPCSFVEQSDVFGDGLPVGQFDTFEELWQHDRMKEWREMLLGNCRNCPVFDV